MKEINKRHTFVQTGNQSIWGILPLGKDKLLIVCHQNYKKKSQIFNMTFSSTIGNKTIKQLDYY